MSDGAVGDGAVGDGYDINNLSVSERTEIQRLMMRPSILEITVITLAVGLMACSDPTPDRQRHSTATEYDTSTPIDYLPALKGDYFAIESRAVGRKYHIHVRLPENYERDESKSYPVVYLLDGDSLFPLLAPTHLFLKYDENLPEAVLVGIAYGHFDPATNKRNVDFSAPAEDARPGEDGAPHFSSFLEQELLPAVERRYRIDSTRRILLGQSRGGYFVLWSALEAPDIFWGRIASNPSLRPGRERFFANASAHTRSDLEVIVASGSRDTELRKQDAREWSSAWQNRKDAPWHVEFIPIQGGTHAASIGETYRRAMLFLFRDEVAAESRADE